MIAPASRNSSNLNSIRGRRVIAYQDTQRVRTRSLLPLPLLALYPLDHNPIDAMDQGGFVGEAVGVSGSLPVFGDRVHRQLHLQRDLRKVQAVEHALHHAPLLRASLEVRL